MLKCGQREVTTKDFYGNRQITDIFTIDVNKVVISYNVPCNNLKDYRYIVGSQLDESQITFFIKTPKNIFSYGVSQYDKNSAYTMSFNVSEEKAWKTRYEKIWNEVESQLRQWQVENGERTHKDKFSWSRCSIRHALQRNSTVKDWFCLQTR